MERHWVESEVPEWIQNSEEEDWTDEPSDGPEYDGEDDEKDDPLNELSDGQ